MDWHALMLAMMTGEHSQLVSAHPYRGGLLGRGVIKPAVVTENSSSVDGTSFATASVTPAASVLHLLAVSCSAAVVESPNSVTGNGITWTAVTNGARSNGGGTRRTSWFYGFGSAPTTGAITIGFAGSHSGCAWALIACPGAALAAPVQATSNADTGTTITSTIAALEYPFNMHIYALGRISAEASAPPATGGWTELTDRTWTTPNGAQEVAWTVSGDLVADPTWVTSAAAQVVSLEIRAA